jgi:hypothetical protein
LVGHLFGGLLLSVVHRHDYFTWVFEAASALIVFAVLTATRKRFSPTGAVLALAWFSGVHDRQIALLKG